MEQGILGLDTSCYTTSVAVMSLGGRLLAESRRLMAVEKGQRGLRQAEGVFQHIVNLPQVVEEVKPAGFNIVGVAASIKPRPLPDSYLPVFRVGEGWGRSLAAALGVPFYPTTHQTGHFLAGIWSVGWLGGERRDTCPPFFLAVHLSGGTTEFLRVRWREGVENEGWLDPLEIERLGGTTDLHAGQFIDRVGVAMGLPFPAGPHLEELAEGDDGSVTLPSSVHGYEVSFSGATTAALRELERGALPAAVAGAVERCVTKTLVKVLRRAVAETGIRDILIVGGVAANRHLRKRLFDQLGHPAVGARLFFADPGFSGDNAVGVAVAGVLQWQKTAPEVSSTNMMDLPFSSSV